MAEMNKDLIAQDVKYNGEVSWSSAPSREGNKVRLERSSWVDFCKHFTKPKVSNLTRQEYDALTKEERLAEKDTGYFVGAEFRNNTRNKNNVICRTMVTLDLDNDIPPDILKVLAKFGFGALIHTTRNSTPHKLRCRVVFPLNRSCTTEEYLAIWNHIQMCFAEQLIDIDTTSRDPAHCMFWPSIHKDGKYDVRYMDLPWIDVDAILKQNNVKLQVAQASLLSDPSEKGGIIGEFCRMFTIQETIKLLLSDIYEQVSEDRYTYVKGSGSGGAIVYNDGKYMYSNHSTDPACGQMLNAFDLVRVHRYGEMSMANGTKAMGQLAQKTIDEVSGSNVHNCKTIDGITSLILEDPALVESIAYDEFSYRNTVVGNLPWIKFEERTTMDWTELDEAQLLRYMEREYGVTSQPKLETAKLCAFSENSFHPVRQYLEGLTWDGKPRLDSLFIDQLGADDTAYVRAVTRKALVGAVARVMDPGCKHDYTPVLIGPQGSGKSSLIRALGKEWFSDSVRNVGNEKAYEQLVGAWIIEFGELEGLSRNETTTIKHFLTKQTDIYRKAYGRQTFTYPRQCIFFGTTNESEFLNDPTGNRRFWPIEVKAWTRQPLDVDQVWAETITAYRAGEINYFEAEEVELEQEVKNQQAIFTVASSKQGMIEQFLDTPVPKTWDKWPIAERQFYIKYHTASASEFDTEELVRRDAVCAAEIWVELFGEKLSTLRQKDATEIKQCVRNIKGWTEKKYHNFGPIFGKQRGFVRC